MLRVWSTKVGPTTSGLTIDRRDHVLTGFFTPELFILSIFSSRCGSTNGPFFNDLAIDLYSLVVSYFFLRRSMMKRSLALRLARVLNPFASCPHGLTG